MDFEDLWYHLSIFSVCRELKFSWVEEFQTVSSALLEGLQRRLLSLNREPVSSDKVLQFFALFLNSHLLFFFLLAFYDRRFQFTNEFEVVDTFIKMFGEALQRCLIGLTEASRSVAILFSGGVDSLLIALLAQRFLPAHCFIDLINVSFDEKSGVYTSFSSCFLVLCFSKYFYLTVKK